MACNNLLVIGGGPSGLSTAINAASEGLAVTILDRADTLGGQFHESNDVENFPGVPLTTGPILSAAMIQQAHQFGVNFCCPVTAAKISVRQDGAIVLTTDDYDEYVADAVVLALGLQYRRLDAPGVAQYMGRGVYYGAAPYIADAITGTVIVGGGNSAGQQAVKLAETATRTVYIVVRGTLESKMSDYLVKQVRALKNIEVVEGDEVVSVAGATGWLNGVTLKTGRELEAQMLMIYIGAIPHTFWLSNDITLDDHRFILTDPKFGTNLPGVFAIGDARAGSVKRIASAVGEGSMVVPSIHSFLTTKDAHHV